MILLTLDPATSTGYTLTEIDDECTTANIYDYGIIDVETDSEYQGDKCIYLMERIQELIDTHWVNHIAVEDYFFNKRTANGSNLNAAFRTAIYILARQNSIDYTILSISGWKKFITGRCTPTKEQKKLWGREMAKKICVQDSLWLR
jgi:Holliday junction resolvasome RuvABC endonuclease subunit